MVLLADTILPWTLSSCGQVNHIEDTLDFLEDILDLLEDILDHLLSPLHVQGLHISASDGVHNSPVHIHLILLLLLPLSSPDPPPASTDEVMRSPR